MGLSLWVAAGCGKKDETTPQTTAGRGGDTLTKASPAPTPEWVRSRAAWPDTMRLTIDSTFEVRIEDLRLRLNPAISQDVSNQRFQNEKPLLCEIITTMSPVPQWALAKGFVLDSVIARDPLNHRRIRTFHMLSFQRSYENERVRTQFLANQGDAYRQSPELVENQELDLTVYMTWDQRHLVASLPPTTLKFVQHPADAPHPENVEPAYPPPPTGGEEREGGP